MNTAIDITHTRQHWPQFDPDQPDDPATTRLDSLLHGESEISAEQFVDWLADEAQRETLYHMLVDRLGDDDIKNAARQWAEEVA